MKTERQAHSDDPGMILTGQVVDDVLRGVFPFLGRSDAMPLTLADIFAARRRIRGLADATPFIPSPFMSERVGHEFLMKWR